MWDLIVSVPDHCLSFYFIQCIFQNNTSRCNSEPENSENVFKIQLKNTLVLIVFRDYI